MAKMDTDRLIEDFLEGKLDKESKQAFDNRMKNDREFANEVAKYQKLESALNATGAENLKNEMHDWDQTHQRRAESSKVFQIKRVYSIAAVILLLITAGVVFYNLNSKLNAADLYAANYTPYEDMILTRDASGKEHELLLNGMEAYNQGDFQNAASILNEYLELYPDNAGVALYLGISQMETGNFAAADQSFFKAQGDSSFSQQAEWYQMLGYLKANHVALAKAALEAIHQNPNHYRSQKAFEMLEHIKRIK